MSTTERVVLVAGASSGIGRATAVAAAERGHRVFGSSRDRDRVTAPGVRGVRLEVADETSADECVGEVLEAAGRIDAVVYSAGFYLAGAIEETSAVLALKQFDAYLFGAHRLVRAVLPAMREQRAGRLIFMSSSAAVAAIPFHAFYSASKAALERYVDGLRYEVEPFGIEAAYVEGTSVRTGGPAPARSADRGVPLGEHAGNRAVPALAADRRGARGLRRHHRAGH